MRSRFGERKLRYFKTYEDAKTWIKDVYAHNVLAVFGLIGFYLDQPVNLEGWTGWDIIGHQALGKKLWW